MKALLKLTILVGLFLSAGCAMMMEERSFVDEMDYETDGFFVPGQDFQVTPGDSGQAYWNDEDIKNRTPASAFGHEERLQQNSLQRELRNRVSRLDENEYREYKRNEQYLPTDSEKIYYLKLPRQQRNEYLSAKNLNYSVSSKPYVSRPNLLPSVYNRQVTVAHGVYQGMEKRDVEDTWGRPERVDVAGDPQFENERWIYNRGGKAQVVYFESGRVSGWTLE